MIIACLAQQFGNQRLFLCLFVSHKSINAESVTPSCTTSNSVYSRVVLAHVEHWFVLENTSIKLEQDVEDVQGINVVDSDTEGRNELN